MRKEISVAGGRSDGWTARSLRRALISYSRRPRLQAYIAKQIQINDLTRRCQRSKIPHAHLRSPPAQDKRGVDLISNLLPFGRLWYGEPDAISNAVGYAKFYSRSHDAVIRVYDEAGNVIEPHEHAGDFREP